MGVSSSAIRHEILTKLFGDKAKTYLASLGVDSEQEMPPVHSHQEALSSTKQLTELPYDTTTIEAAGKILANPALSSPPEQAVLIETYSNPLAANVNTRLRALNTMLREFLSPPVRLQEGSEVWREKILDILISALSRAHSQEAFAFNSAELELINTSFLLTLVSREQAPAVLLKMAQYFSEMIINWHSRTLFQREKKTSQTQAVLAAKALISLALRTHPEVRSKVGQTIEHIIETKKSWERWRPANKPDVSAGWEEIAPILETATIIISDPGYQQYRRCPNDFLRQTDPETITSGQVFFNRERLTITCVLDTKPGSSLTVGSLTQIRRYLTWHYFPFTSMLIISQPFSKNGEAVSILPLTQQQIYSGLMTEQNLFYKLGDDNDKL